MKKRLLIGLTFLFLSSTASAFSGSDFVNKCANIGKSTKAESANEAVNRALDAGSCSGFVGGVINGVNLVGNMLRQQGAAKKNFICLPQQIHASELLERSVTFISRSEEMQNLPAQAGIYKAMMKEYACK